MNKYAIVAGTGFDNYFKDENEIIVSTDFGNVILNEVFMDGYILYYIPRHGKKHNVSPSNINYRAHAMAIKNLNIDHVYGICAVGSLRKELPVGSIVLNNDFLDMTKNRIYSFYTGDIVKHLEVSNPYSNDLNRLFYLESKKYNLNVSEGIYVCTEGPRFESKTEIKLYQMLNCDVVGMTNIPEVLLFNELNISYSCISYVTNYCTGILDTITSDSFNSESIKKDLIIKTIFDCFKKDPKKLKIVSNQILL
ncbi:MTAP family purine nucleoside phosphorylase [Anaerosphaera multitolerans]|uniref:S-methyl-5'-thioadenosine phosphorylase n=1 Tax=Anaerosphaera multitolerans TaxID=2487351 RepID=A0A437S7W9_9FIRM|nr:MTAP family purine nucleoside phosphorylase [Anaerosphaera multitolerans]RVU55166.1 S-methyl-5'-thioadenosine phosphorylase [Anaerosphaera multitolerans]